MWIAPLIAALIFKKGMEGGKLFVFCFPLTTGVDKMKITRLLQHGNVKGLIPAMFPSIPCGNQAAVSPRECKSDPPGSSFANNDCDGEH